jgi:hypothetical protein
MKTRSPQRFIVRSRLPENLIEAKVGKGQLLSERTSFTGASSSQSDPDLRDGESLRSGTPRLRRPIYEPLLRPLALGAQGSSPGKSFPVAGIGGGGESLVRRLEAHPEAVGRLAEQRTWMLQGKKRAPGISVRRPLGCITKKRGRGRPATGRDPTTSIRMSEELRARLDQWAGRQPDKPTRAEAMRRLIEMSLGRAGWRKEVKI